MRGDLAACMLWLMETSGDCSSCGVVSPHQPYLHSSKNKFI